MFGSPTPTKQTLWPASSRAAATIIISLAENGVVIYLRAAVHDLWSRTRHDKNRPLLKTAEPVAKLEQLYAERDPLYRETADIIVDTGNQSLGSLAHKLEQQVEQFKTSARRPDDSPARAS